MNPFKLGMTKFVNNGYQENRQFQKHKKEEDRKKPQNRLNNASVVPNNPNCLNSHYQDDGSLLSPTYTSTFSFEA